MSHRQFASEKMPAAQGASRILRITCRCGATDTFPSKGKPPVAAEQSFRRKGWTIGSSPSRDRCPTCSTSKPRLVKAFEEIHKIIDQEPAHMTTTKPELTVVADAPAMPTREERRIIFAKLEEVYVDEKVGYSNGWSDHRVATDLSVPRAWVEMIRAENFGDAKDNPDIREFLEKLARLESEWAAATAAVEKHAKELATNLGWQQDVANRLKDLGRIAKAVAPLTK